LLFSALVVYMRLVGHGLLPSLNQPRMQGAGDTLIVQSGRRSKGFVGDSSAAQSWQSSPALAEMRLQQAAKSPQGKLVGTITMILFLAFPLWNMYKFRNRVTDENPERQTVSSKDDALRKIPEENDAVEKESDNQWAYKQRGVNYFDAEMYDQAIPDLSFTLSKSKDDDTYWTRARCYQLTHQWQKALADYQEMTKLSKQDYMCYKAWRGVGICSYYLGKYQQAADAFTEALKHHKYTGDHERNELYNDRALAYQKLGKKDLAQTDLKGRGSDTSKWWLKDDATVQKKIKVPS
jgi:tetratricopeptide (TPR) repeat protein